MQHWIKRINPALLALLMIAIPHLIYVLSRWYAIPMKDGMPVGQTDPDTWLRLTLVRDWLTGGGWYNHHVVNSDAPFGGTTSPWTRPVDMVLALFVYLQPESVDISQRILRASLLMPWVWMVLLLAGIHRAIRYLMPLPSAYFMGSVLVATMPMTWNYFGLGNADHHAPLAALFVWAMGGVLAPTPSRRLMLFTGFLLGLQLWISVESFILIGIIYGWFAIQWLRGDYRMATALAWLSTATALTSILALAIEVQPPLWRVPVYDSISVVYIYALCIAALAAWVLHLLATPYLRDRIVIALITGALAIAAIATVYPHLPLGPLYGVDPFIISDFLPRITEAKPFYKVEPLALIVVTYLPLLTLIACLAPWIRRDRAFFGNDTSIALVYFLATCLLLYYSQQRWSYYLLPLTICVVAPMLGALFTPENKMVASRWPATLMHGLTPNQQANRRMPIIILLIGAPIVAMLLSALPQLLKNSANTAAQANSETQRNACYNAARQLIRSGELNRVLPKPMTILAPTDLGTEILFFTPHRIIASNYHREGAAIKYLWEAKDITDSNALRAHLANRKVDALLLCPLIEFKKGSLIQSYATGAPLPAWLTPIAFTLPPLARDANKQHAPIIPPTVVKVKNY